MSTQNKATVLEMVAYRGTRLIDESVKKIKTFELTRSLAEGLFNSVYTRQPNTLKKEAITAYLYFDPLFTVLTGNEIKSNSLQPLVGILENKEKKSLNDQFNAFQSLSIAPLAAEEELNIWLNVIHQMFRKEPTSLSDDLIRILRANHIVKSALLTAEDFKKAAQSKPVLPRELFDESFHFAQWETEEKEPRVAKKKVISAADDKQLKVVQAETMIAGMKKIQPKIELLQKDFDQRYKTAYELSLKNFERETEAQLKDYQLSVNTSLQRSFEKLGDKVIKYTTDNPYLQPETVTNVSLPKFGFEMKAPLDLEFVKKTFTEHEMHLLLYALDYDFSQAEQTPEGDVTYTGADTLLSSYSGYNEWGIAVADKLSQLNREVIENTSVGQSFVKIGAFYMPVTEAAETIQPLSFNLVSKANALQENVSLNFSIPHVQDEIESIRFTRTVNGKEVESRIMADKFVKRGNSISVANFDTIGHLYNSNLKDGTVYKIDFNLADGTVFKVPESILFPNTGIGGGITPADNTPVVDEEALLAPYIPSGFGVKQLGVADYKKVVQTVKCYEEGEVSHIENIMAREYREKSARTLRHKENTTTSSTSSEREQIKDTASASRFEMQNELSKIAREDQNFASQVQANYSPPGAFSISTGVSYANNQSQEESSRQSIQKAQELTERALNRVTTNVLEERIQTVIEEYEENNRHGFDNRTGENHVVGVYRWVDKLYNNQMVNYGKRMMFEFMVPEPARIHKLGAQNKSDIYKPEDPRTSAIRKINSAGALTENVANFWATKYNVEISPVPAPKIHIGKSLAVDIDVTREVSHISFGSVKEDIEIPDGYKSSKAKVVISAVDDNDQRGGKGVIVNLGNRQFRDITKNALVQYVTNTYENIDSFVGSLPVSATFANYFSGSISVSIMCQRTEEMYKQWQQETFHAIISAYEDALNTYNTKVATSGEEKDKTNPLFYRQIENIALRKNCISYLINQQVMGGITLYEGSTASTYKVLMKENLDKYAGLVKFLEQAFEWDIMSYTFYPYYWANRAEWNALYQYNESDDALFRSFMQSGMARVVATVRPGFETAVAWFLKTGKIWNGGEVPVINDELYVSVLDEVLEAVATEEGEPWITRVPTTLTILQAQSIGLEVTTALPCDCDGEDCDSNFKLSEAKLGVQTPAPAEA